MRLFNKLLAKVDLAFIRRSRITHAERQAKRADTEAKRADTEAKRADTEAKRADTEAKHADTEAKRADIEAERADIEAERADTEAKRADTEAKRADTEAERADTEAKRADAEAKRADTEAKRADTEAKRADTEAKRADAMQAILKAVEQVKNEVIELNYALPPSSLKLHAALSTADYIIKHLPRAPYFAKETDLLRHALGKKMEQGLVLEFGVYRGRTINIISEYSSTVFGFDSFEGLPEDWRTRFGQGVFKMDVLPEVKDNVVLIQGWFSDTLPRFLETHQEDCAFLHIDCDLYSSTQTIFALVRDRIKPGTLLVFDEFFNYPSWEEGEYKAFMEYVRENGVEFEFLGYSREQVAVKILKNTLNQ